ncbi:Tetrahydromethanopterin S-methyltransferase subunit B [Candidatus Methanoperedenaceae archaeon GB50]|nr:Tetrahydromethanopterin S-methyltransferase subunit B [Candidatus Methanoperedenaceae archaeon GB50]
MYVLIDLEENVALNPETGLLGEMDEHLITTNLALMMESVERLARIGKDLFDSLDPTTTPMVSYPNREGIYRNAGRIANLAYGFIFGMLLAALVALALKGGM